MKSDWARVVALSPYVPEVDGYTISVEARAAAPALGQYGIVFNGNDDLSQYYYLFVDVRWPTVGGFGIGLRYYDNGAVYDLALGAVSGASVQLYQPNVLEVDVYDQEIWAYVDGVQQLYYNAKGGITRKRMGLYSSY